MILFSIFQIYSIARHSRLTSLSRTAAVFSFRNEYQVQDVHFRITFLKLNIAKVWEIFLYRVKICKVFNWRQPSQLRRARLLLTVKCSLILKLDFYLRLILYWKFPAIEFQHWIVNGRHKKHSRLIFSMIFKIFSKINLRNFPFLIQMLSRTQIISIKTQKSDRSNEASEIFWISFLDTLIS